MTPDQLDQVRLWSRQEAAAAQQAAEQAQTAATPLWMGFAGWYSATEVAQPAQVTGQIASAAHELAGGVGMSYATEVLRTLGAPSGAGMRYTPPALRNGVDVTTLYARVAAEHNRVFALTADEAAATQAAIARLNRMLGADVLLGRRAGERLAMDRAGVTRYMRLLHPELATTGSCGLCIAASDRVYKIANLLPIHDGCNCSTMPLLGANVRPGDINRVDLAALYDAAGSTRGRDLKRVRVRVEEHGELGPVLVDARHRFQGPGEADNVDSLARARTRLQKAEVALERMRDDGVTKAIPYQLNLIDSLRQQLAA